MRKHPAYFGRGDFSNMFFHLINFKKDYKDLANKLVLLKTGHFYRKGFQIDVNDENDNNPGEKGSNPENMMKLYSD
jgi:hypothetical protein